MSSEAHLPFKKTIFGVLPFFSDTFIKLKSHKSWKVKSIEKCQTIMRLDSWSQNAEICPWTQPSPWKYIKLQFFIDGEHDSMIPDKCGDKSICWTSDKAKKGGFIRLIMHPHTFISMFHINSNLGIPYFLDKANCFSVFQAYSSPFFRQMRAKKRREMGHFPSRLTHCTSRVAPNDRKKTWKTSCQCVKNDVRSTVDLSQKSVSFMCINRVSILFPNIKFKFIDHGV